VFVLSPFTFDTFIHHTLPHHMSDELVGNLSFVILANDVQIDNKKQKNKKAMFLIMNLKFIKFYLKNTINSI
jgi:fructose-specific phosphotransferase system component IIB